MQVTKGIKRFFLDQPGDPYWLRYSKTVFLVVPLVTLFMSGLFSGEIPKLLPLGFSMIISLTVVNVCFVMTGMVTLVRGPLSRRHSFLLGLIAMVPGMLFGCRLAEIVYAHFGHPWKVQGLANYSGGYIVGAGIFALTVLAESYEESKLRVARVENERLQAQIAALTAQMNPHLLFNALNTVAAMIPEDPQRAEEMTVMLADLYRGVLDSSRRSTHSLERELEICRTYLAVEEARYGSRLNVRFTVDPALRPSEIDIPVLTVQPLVENAVRHGISPRAEGGTVAVKVENDEGKLRIAIEDDGAGLGKSSSRGAGTGIHNCRTRLGMQYGERGTLDVRGRDTGGTVATIEVPL